MAKEARNSGEARALRMMPVDSLVPYEKNPRYNDGAVEFVANSIKAFGFRNPILVDKDMVVIAGHTRIKAAKRLGLAAVPVIVCDDLPPEKVAALRLADNKTAELAAWDETALQEELDSIAGLDLDFKMEDFGFNAIGPSSDGGQSISEEKEIDGDDLEEIMELRISLPFDDYQAVTDRLRSINPDFAKAIVALCAEKGE